MTALRFSKLLLMGMFLLVAPFTIRPVGAFDWVDYVVGDLDQEAVATDTLSLQEIGELRVRDIKRRLQRTHGYTADDVGRMLDKKDLINALAFEEHKTRERKLDRQKRYLLKRGVIAALVVVAIVMFWPLLSHAYEVALVNFVVYTDRKRLEARRCFELKSIPGFIGVTLMFIMEGLQIWLSVSILLSWVMRSKYFFPVPNLSVHPAQFMGGEVASGPLSRYGFNLGPMIISWALRFINSQIEGYTGKVLASAHREQRKQQREQESQQEKEERKARKAARRAAREAAREQAEAAAANRPPGPRPPMQDSVFPPQKEQPNYDRASVDAFLGEEHAFTASNGSSDQEEEPTSTLDELD